MTIYPDRIVRHSGILNRTETVDPVWRIQDVKSVRKWYGFGWIYLETAGEDSDEGFGPIRNVTEVRDVIYHLLRPTSANS
jgi:membrane protein YdbS with pleckstrin-like domain